MKVSEIDLFAGPGGLGEGFSAFRGSRNSKPFRIRVSVEKESSAHRTLELRAFFRQFGASVPDQYYSYLRGENSLTREELFRDFPEQYTAATEETLGGPRALGNETDDLVITGRLRAVRRNGGPFVVIGGPPCQAYSLVGRARNKGIKGYRADKDERHFLYEEYLRVLWEMKPEVFVMENVKGILSSKVSGTPVFPTILTDLKHPGKALGKIGGKGYVIYTLVPDSDPDLFGNSNSEFIIRAEDYGVPQARHRVILLGVRSDIDVTPEKLIRAASKRTTNSVIGDLPPLRSGLSKSADSAQAWRVAVENAVNKVARSKPPFSFSRSDRSCIIEKMIRLESRGSRFVKVRRKFRGDKEASRWFLDKRLNGVANHESRGHIEDDLARYFFCSMYAHKTGASPKACEFPASLAPNHANWESGKFVDRFKVQVASKPSSTITSHISKDGHYFIHPDPSQCRSLTVREAARIQTFPDNYFFEGNRTQQYVQVGNAVPPMLANQIAKIVYRILSDYKNGR